MKFILNAPHITETKTRARLCCEVQEITTEAKTSSTLFIEVEKKYKQYLVDEVTDSFVVAILPYACLHGFDIECETITDELYHNLMYQLLPAIVKYNPHNKPISISAKQLISSSEYDTEWGQNVGTGISMGVDAFDVINTYTNMVNGPIDKYKLTALCLNNVGGFSTATDIPDQLRQRTTIVANELGLPVVYVNSNIHLWKKIDWLLAHSYRNAALVMALGKYWRTYYYASGYDLDHFNIHGNPAAYDCFLLSCLSTKAIRFYSVGHEKTRFDKTKDITSFEITHKYLDSCLYSIKCGKCEKCLRNIVILDSLNKLDEYRKCFDLTYWSNNKTQVIMDLIHDKTDEMLSGAYNQYIITNNEDFKNAETQYMDICNQYSKYYDPYYTYQLKEMKNPQYLEKYIEKYKKNKEKYVEAVECLSEYENIMLKTPRLFAIYIEMMKKVNPNKLLDYLDSLKLLSDNAACCYHLATIYLEQHQNDDAIYWMRKAANKKYGWSMNELFDLLWARGNDADFTEAYHIAKQFSETNSGAMGRLGKAYREGKGIDKDLNLAIYWMEKAARENPAWKKELAMTKKIVKN